MGVGKAAHRAGLALLVACAVTAAAQGKVRDRVSRRIGQRGADGRGTQLVRTQVAQIGFRVDQKVSGRLEGSVRGKVEGEKYLAGEMRRERRESKQQQMLRLAKERQLRAHRERREAAAARARAERHSTIYEKRRWLFRGGLVY